MNIIQNLLGIAPLIISIASIVISVVTSVWSYSSTRAVLKIRRSLYYYKFENSLRFYLVVRNDSWIGKVSVPNAVCTLTIDEENWKKLKDYIVNEKLFRCRENSICAWIPRFDNEDVWKPLISDHNSVSSIEDEVLPWTVPQESGTGLDNAKYKYLGLIPYKGSNKCLLFDLYYVNGKPENEKCKDTIEPFYVLRIFSEYGTEAKPRLILKLPDKSTDLEIKFYIKVSGNSIRKCDIMTLVIKYEKSDYIMYVENEQSNAIRFGDFFDKNNNTNQRVNADKSQKIKSLGCHPYNVDIR